MNRRMTFTLFLTVMVLVYLGVHLYLGLRLVTALELEGTAPLLLGGGLSILVAFAFPVTRLLARIAPAAGVRIVDRVVSMWLGAALYLVLMTLATVLSRESRHRGAGPRRGVHGRDHRIRPCERLARDTHHRSDDPREGA
jgi:hypothetical protein